MSITPCRNPPRTNPIFSRRRAFVALGLARAGRVAVIVASTFSVSGAIVLSELSIAVLTELSIAVLTKKGERYNARKSNGKNGTANVSKTVNQCYQLVLNRQGAYVKLDGCVHARGPILKRKRRRAMSTSQLCRRVQSAVGKKSLNSCNHEVAGTVRHGSNVTHTTTFILQRTQATRIPTDCKYCATLAGSQERAAR